MTAMVEGKMSAAGRGDRHRCSLASNIMGGGKDNHGN